jgi:hypothetical protein
MLKESPSATESRARVLLVTISPMETELSHVGSLMAGRGDRMLAEVSSVPAALL